MTAADLYLRLSDARNEEALDGRAARLQARAAELGWTVHQVIVENDLTPGNGNGAAPGVGVETAQDHDALGPCGTANDPAGIPVHCSTTSPRGGPARSSPRI